MDPGRYFILFYDYIDNVVELRAPHRPAHLELIGDYKAAGRVVVGGVLGDPPTGAAIVFRGDSDDQVREFVESDPYYRNGLVTEWRVVPWTVAV